MTCQRAMTVSWGWNGDIKQWGDAPFAEIGPHYIIRQCILAIPSKGMKGVHVFRGSGNERRRYMGVVPRPNELAVLALAKVFRVDGEFLNMPCERRGTGKHGESSFALIDAFEFYRSIDGWNDPWEDPRGLNEGSG